MRPQRPDGQHLGEGLGVEQLHGDMRQKGRDRVALRAVDGKGREVGGGEWVTEMGGSELSHHSTDQATPKQRPPTMFFLQNQISTNQPANATQAQSQPPLFRPR